MNIMTKPAAARSEALDVVEAFNVVSARLSMIEGSLSAITCAYDDKERAFALTPPYLNKALKAIEELRDQCAAAFGLITADHSARSSRAKRRGDPTLAAIASHREALAAYSDAIDPADEVANPGVDAAEMKRREAVKEAASAEEERALLALCTTRPATFAGLLALMEYVGRPEISDALDIREKAGALLNTLAAAVPAIQRAAAVG